MVRALAPRLAAVPPVRGRFLALARQLAMIGHDALPVVFAMDEKPIPFVVIADDAGESLADRLTRGRTFSCGEVTRIGAAIAAGLAAGHAAGFVHRAFCPANVFLTDDRSRPVRLIDVGLARAVTETLVAPADLPGQAAAFLAPEQVLGDRLDPLDHRPDLFALGCVIGALATGKSPFAAATPEATLRRVAEGMPVPEVMNRLPDDLRAIVAALLAVEPGRRPPSADGVRDRLARLAAQG
jgi:serine/threonine protein kinase